MLKEFELDHNAEEACKNIWSRHSWSQYSNQIVQEISPELQEARQSDDKPGTPIKEDSEAVFQNINASLASNTGRVSGELVISLSSMLRKLYDHRKNILSSQIMPKYGKIFDPPKYYWNQQFVRLKTSLNIKIDTHFK